MRGDGYKNTGNGGKRAAVQTPIPLTQGARTHGQETARAAVQTPYPLTHGARAHGKETERAVVQTPSPLTQGARAHEEETEKAAVYTHNPLAQGAFVQWKSPAWGELQATNLMVRRPSATLPTTVTRCVRRPSAARPTAAAQPALHNYGNAVRGLRPHQNGIFESTIQLIIRFHAKCDQNIIYE